MVSVVQCYNFTFTGTVTTLVVRNYRARENEAVTAMLGIVLKNDGSDTEESRQEKNLRVHAHVRAPAMHIRNPIRKR